MQYKLNLPLQVEDIKKLRIGDVVYISGKILTARDEAHARILEFNQKGEELPFRLDGGVIYHCGPLMQYRDDSWHVVAAGPTTSNRMSGMTPEIFEKYGVHVLIGKGGMKGLAETFRKYCCVYLAYTGGCAALASQSIKKVASVYWYDLGMAEAVWEFQVEEFGPLIVGIDSEGNDLFETINENARMHLYEYGKCTPGNDCQND